MIFEDFKKMLNEKALEKGITEEEKGRLKKEIHKASIAYDNGIDVFSMLKEADKKPSNRYVIPYLLDLTDTIDMSKPLEIKQAKKGSGGK